MTHGVLMDRNVLPCICGRSCSAADYHDMEVLWIQTRYPTGHLSQEAVKRGCCSHAYSPLVIPLKFIQPS